MEHVCKYLNYKIIRFGRQETLFSCCSSRRLLKLQFHAVYNNWFVIYGVVDLCVHSQPACVCERPAARFTFELLPARVHEHYMGFESIVLREWPATYLTVVRLLSGVSLEVLVEAAQRNKSHVAAFTSERFVAAVSSLVSDELRLDSEGLVTKVTAVVLLSHVHTPLVRSETGRRGVTLPAVIAGKPRLWMGEMMRLEISKGFELLFTNAAAERRLICVRELMFLQLVQSIKHPPANITRAFLFLRVFLHMAVQPTA